MSTKNTYILLKKCVIILLRIGGVVMSNDKNSMETLDTSTQTITTTSSEDLFQPVTKTTVIDPNVPVSDVPIVNNNPVNVNPATTKDIPTSFFKPITEVQNQQDDLVDRYQNEVEKNNPVMNFNKSPDLSGKVNKLEKQLEKKKFMMSPALVLVIVIVINLAWFLSLKLIILPKYDSYVKQSDEISQNYATLKSRVDAIVGE